MRISGTVHDITQQEETARQLHRHEEEFRLLVESSPDLILRFNQDMRCVYANPAIQHALGLSPSQIVSKHLQEIPLPTNLRRVWSNSIRKVLETRQSSLFEYSFATATGRKHFQTRVVPAFDVRTGVRHALAIAQDVSALKENEVMLRELSAHTEMVREQERKKIAREVHDELGQALTALRMDAALLRLDLGDEHPCSARVDNMKKALDHTLKIARDVTTALRPAALDLGLIAALEWLVNDFRRHFGWTCFLHTNSECARLDDSRATALFRIVQESLNNVAKHADATEVMVSVLLQPKEIYLEVCDNGVGFDLGARRQPQSFGLLGIGERVRMLNGSLEIESSPQTGTRLKVVLPLATNRLNTSASNKLEEQP